MILDRVVLFSLMAKQGLSRAELAERAGVTKQAVSLWMLGKRKKIDTVRAGKLAAALGVDVMELGAI